MRDLAFYRHELFRLTTDNGEKYAFDLTSSQHGYYEPIVPWNSYEKLRVSKVCGRVMFGGTEIEDLIRTKSFIEQQRTTVFGYFTACLNKILQDWQIDNTSFNILLTLPDQEFERMSSDLYRRIEAHLNHIVPWIYGRNAGR